MSWRLSLKKTTITCVFWESRGDKGKAYIPPVTKKGKNYRRARLGATKDLCPSAQAVLMACSLRSVDLPNLAEVAIIFDEGSLDWLRRSSNCHFYYCIRCYPQLASETDFGVLDHVALFCRSDVLLHEHSPHHKAVGDGFAAPALPVDYDCFLKFGAALCASLHECRRAIADAIAAAAAAAAAGDR
jgi:hypothetical protein